MYCPKTFVDEEANGEKFLPHVVVTDTNKLATLTALIELANSLESRKLEERMSLLLSDYDFETEDPSVVDVAVCPNARAERSLD